MILFKQHNTLDGFTFKPGFIGLTKKGKIIAATSGHRTTAGGFLQFFVYRPTPLGWSGKWESEKTFPVERAAEMLKQALIDRTRGHALNYLKNRDPFITTNPIEFIGKNNTIDRYEPTGEHGLYYHSRIWPARFFEKYQEEFLGIVGIDAEKMDELTLKSERAAAFNREQERQNLRQW